MQFSVLGATLSTYAFSFPGLSILEPLWYISAATTIGSGLGYLDGSGLKQLGDSNRNRSSEANNPVKTILSLVRSSTPSEFLRDLVPSRRVLTLLFVKSSNEMEDCNIIGAAISDPYLSFASPIDVHTTSISEFLTKAVPEYDVGGIVVIRKPILDDGCDYESDQEGGIKQLMKLKINSSNSTNCRVFCTKSDVAARSLQDVERESKLNPLWDSIPIDDILHGKSPVAMTQIFSSGMGHESILSVHAAIGLQQFLDHHCRGWQNTFG